MKTLWLLLAMFAPLAGVGQNPSPSRPWRYELLEGSIFIDDCPICDRLTVPHRMRGTFELLLDDINVLFTTYRMTNIQFYAGDKRDPLYTLTGHGTYRVGGEVAVQQDMTLTTEVCNTTPSCRSATFTNDDRAVQFAFPLIESSLTETGGSLVSVYKIRLVAAPVQEIWLTITNAFTPTNGGAVVRAGDVLSNSGRAVRTNARLLEQVGLTNPSPSLRVDAFNVVPGGEIYFSLNENAVSPTLGPLYHGDLLSNRGRIVQRNQQLTAAFGIKPVVPDVGLDAVHIQESGEILFSIRTNILSETQGTMLMNGDVLSNKGQVVKRNRDLRAKFNTEPPVPDRGLDALYVWPHGEIWFSLEDGFSDARLGPVSGGDLLSTEGFIVFKNAELVSEFEAPAGISNFGLADIFVVTDAAVGSPPRFLSPGVQQGNFTLQWAGTNRVFQLQRAPTVTGPWDPLGVIDPDPFFIDAGVLSGNTQNFYRLRAW